MFLYNNIIHCNSVSKSVSGSDPSLHQFYDMLRPDKILSTDCRVLIVDQICLVIPDPCHSLQFCQKKCQWLTLCHLCWMVFYGLKILSTDGGVLIIDQIYLVILDSRQSPDAIQNPEPILPSYLRKECTAYICAFIDSNFPSQV